MVKKEYVIRCWFLLLFLMVAVEVNAVIEGLPAWYVTTTNLNVRTLPNPRAAKLVTLAKGTRVEVLYIDSNFWAEIRYNGRPAYCSANYLRYVESSRPVPIESNEVEVGSDSSILDLDIWPWVWHWIWKIGLTFVVLLIMRAILQYCLDWISSFVYKIYRLISFPFYCLNWFQRYLSKPWLPFFKHNTRTNSENEEMRDIMQWIGYVCYVIVTPLRFVNAVYYNMFVHCSLEMLNYLLEVVAPYSDKEGGKNLVEWTLWLPWRILKYPMWHGSLTLIESSLWTVADTFIPTLTLYHGTASSASVSITQCPGRIDKGDWYTGIWNVGGGNYAGDGIYFAPARSTAFHYSSGALIVCRVSLGKTLDLGLAPKDVYNQCGNPNAHGVTKWGLDHGYVTGEWWRGDTRARWWEYCMYDWKNRYNYSWRIRPLYVLSLCDESIQRIPGGMAHWLFRKMVIEDISTSIEKCLE
jgi:hypothetical protein